MPSSQINYRYTIPAGAVRELSYEMKKDAILTEGFMHFPPGCVGAVQIRVLLERDKFGNIKQVTPVNDDYVALDDATYPFVLDEEIEKGDKVIVQIRNTGANEHTVSAIITQEYPGPEGFRNPFERLLRLQERRGRMQRSRRM